MSGALPFLKARWSTESVPDPDSDLIVLLHGYGSNEDVILRQVAPHLAGDIRIASLRGPIAEGRGFAWVSMQDSRAAQTTDAIRTIARSAAQPLLSWLDSQPPFRSTGLFGVSQGAVMALHLLRLAPSRFSYAVNLSGYVLAGEEAGDSTLRAIRPPVWWGRGQNDDVIPADYVERTRTWLPAHTRPISKVYDTGHEETTEKFIDAAAFVHSVTSAQAGDPHPSTLTT